VVFKLLPQVPHVDPQVMAVFHIGRPPDFSQELAMGENLSWVAQQDGEQAKFDRA